MMSTSNTEEGCGIEQTVHDVDDEDECRLLVHRRKHDVQHPVRTVELPQAAMIASFQDESKLLLAIKAAACGVNLTAGSLADSVIRLGNGERAAAQEFFGRILPAIKDQRQDSENSSPRRRGSFIAATAPEHRHHSISTRERDSCKQC